MKVPDNMDGMSLKETLTGEVPKVGILLYSDSMIECILETLFYLLTKNIVSFQFFRIHTVLLWNILEKVHLLVTICSTLGLLLLLFMVYNTFF